MEDAKNRACTTKTKSVVMYQKKLSELQKQKPCAANRKSSMM